jgi:hypothetical protein
LLLVAALVDLRSTQPIENREQLRRSNLN